MIHPANEQINKDLEFFIENFSSKTKVAKALGLHPLTVSRRLKQKNWKIIEVHVLITKNILDKKYL